MSEFGSPPIEPSESRQGKGMSRRDFFKFSKDAAITAAGVTAANAALYGGVEVFDKITDVQEKIAAEKIPQSEVDKVLGISLEDIERGIRDYSISLDETKVNIDIKTDLMKRRVVQEIAARLGVKIDNMNATNL